jgi:methylmalonyl-CoA mutase N-terminal domain/subunit
LLAKVDDLGGAAKAIGASFFQDEIARSAYEYQLRVERGDTVIVGVNKYADANEPPVIPTPDYSTLEREQVERLRAVRAKRDASITANRLASLRDAARTYVSPGHWRAPLMELIIDAVRARASVGEIADALRDEWGTYRPT